MFKKETGFLCYPGTTLLFFRFSFEYKSFNLIPELSPPQGERLGTIGDEVV